MRWLSVVFAALVLGVLVPASARAESDAQAGKRFAEKNCARCHVVADNPFAGISSTPSFRLLARRDDYEERFRSFYARRPHPVFVRVPGKPPLTRFPSNVVPFEVTLEQIEDLLAYAETLRAE